MLLINNIKFSRSNKTIFSQINISASPGKIFFVKGGNGSGKTTLLKTILYILEPREGEIFWMGKNIKKNLFNYYNNTTFVMDKTTSIRELTVLQNIYLWKKFSSSKISDNEIKKLFKILKLNKYYNQNVMYLSSGETKKLELSRLIIEQKKLWILDEPFNNLDKESFAIIRETFIDHIEREGTIIFSSHFDPSIDKCEIIELLK